MDFKIVRRIATDSSRYAVDGLTGCWNWLGATVRSGHGVVRVGAKTHLAHRVFFRYFVGVLFAGLVTHHLCHNPKCVNPSHLRAMTRAEHNRVHAESHGKLNYDSVREIRILWGEGSMSQVELGRRYGVDHATISLVVLGKTWKDAASVAAQDSQVFAVNESRDFSPDTRRIA
jgi:hypothetical protein